MNHSIREANILYEDIHTMKADHSILALCRKLEVSVRQFEASLVS